MSIAHIRGTYLAARYRRIAPAGTAQGQRRRSTRAAGRDLEHRHDQHRYDDPGGDYFTRLNPQKAQNNAIRQLEAMGYHVTLDKAS